MKRLPTMKQLQYLVALADTRHFGRAAERCHITQSTLSAGIRDLESVLGTAVAERSNRHVLITRVGAQIAERAKALLRDAEEVMEVARAGRSPMTGEMRLGVIPTIGPFLLPRVLPRPPAPSEGRLRPLRLPPSRTCPASSAAPSLSSSCAL